MKAILVCVCFVSLVVGCHIDSTSESKGFTETKARVPVGKPIRAHITLVEFVEEGVARETKIALDIEFEEGAIPKSVKINQLDSAGNPDPCPDILDTTNADREEAGSYSVPNKDGDQVLYTRFIKNDLRVTVEINTEDYSLEGMTIGTNESLFSFRNAVNTGEFREKGEIELVEGKREINKFQDKYFRQNVSPSTSCDEDSGTGN